jgi:hypothetical protein
MYQFTISAPIVLFHVKYVSVIDSFFTSLYYEKAELSPLLTFSHFR